MAETPIKICKKRAQQQPTTLSVTPPARSHPLSQPQAASSPSSSDLMTVAPSEGFAFSGRKGGGETQDYSGVYMQAFKKADGGSGGWPRLVNMATTSSSSLMLCSSPMKEEPETPSAQFARFTIAAGSSSAMVTPMLMGRALFKQAAPVPIELFGDDLDDIGCSLAEILSCDNEEDEEEECPFSMLETITELDEGAVASNPSSSMPPSPCKSVSPAKRMALGDKTNSIGLGLGEVKRHWSRAEQRGDDIVPIPKLRRTVSEVLPSLSLCPLDDSVQQGEDAAVSFPWHTSPKDAIRRLAPKTIVEMLDGKYASDYDRLIIVDSRYPYEHLGGHIPTAINLCGLEAAERFLFSSEMLDASKMERILLVFHCEFSSERAPRMALHIRNLDRSVNAAAYPRLTFPEMYIMEGGYRAYWQDFRERCEPAGQYLPMRAQNFREDLRFHQRMRTTAATSGGFQGNKYSRSKVRALAGGVGLRKTVSTAAFPSSSSSASVAQYMARLAPGEAMPEEFPSSDGPDVFQAGGHLLNCFQ